MRNTLCGQRKSPRPGNVITLNIKRINDLNNHHLAQAYVSDKTNIPLTCMNTTLATKPPNYIYIYALDSMHEVDIGSPSSTSKQINRISTVGQRLNCHPDYPSQIKSPLTLYSMWQPHVLFDMVHCCSPKLANSKFRHASSTPHATYMYMMHRTPSTTPPYMLVGIGIGTRRVERFPSFRLH